jgi:3-oxoadipate CoA-transferase alpha subunit
MIDKRMTDIDSAVADVFDGAVVMVGGFGPAGQPSELLDALIRLKPRGLTLISNNAGNGDYGLAALLKAGCVKKVICSFPRQVDSWVFDDLYRRGEVALELVPQGNLAARIQAGGSGLGASSRQPGSAQSWHRAKRLAVSTAKIMCSKRP